MFVQGSEFAGYRIDALIGQGGMSEVYRADNPRLGNKVALKLLAPQLADDELFRERFLRESRVAAALEHPNVLPIFDAGDVDGVPYIAMRYVDGPDLRKLIDDHGPLALDRTVSIVKQVGGALDCAHEHGLVHRDVKPGNILIDEQVDTDNGDHVYLADFGVAKHNLSQSGLTSTGQFVGTIDYIAPEQIEGKQVDGRTDVYSLACVLFECLAGSPPFERDTNVAMIYAHLLDPPPAISEKRPDLPAALDGVLAKGLAKSRDDRYATCRDLVVDLRAAAGQQASPIASPTNGSETVLARATAAGPEATSEAPTATVLAGGAPAATVAAAGGSTPTIPARSPEPRPAAPPPLRTDATRGARPLAAAGFEPAVPSREGSWWRSRQFVMGLALLVLALAGAGAATTLIGGSSSKPPSAPQSLDAAAVAGQRVKLTWRAPENGAVDGYRIFRNGRQIGTAERGTYVDGPLNQSTLFVYTVRAFTGGKAGPASGRATYLGGLITGPGDPVPPQGVPPPPKPNSQPNTSGCHARGNCPGTSST